MEDNKSTTEKNTQVLDRDTVMGLTADDIKIGGEDFPEDPSTEENLEDVVEEEDVPGEETPDDDQGEDDDPQEEEPSEEKPDEPEGEKPADEPEPEPEKEPETPDPQIDVNQEVNKAIDERSEGKFKDIDELFEAVNSSIKPKDDYIRKAVEYYDKNGDLTPFLEATQRDYESMSAKEILRYKFNKDHEGMSPEARERKFNRDVLAKFKQDGSEDYEEEDIKFGKEEMDFEANKVRKELLKDQQEFLKPAEPETQPEREQPTGPSREEMLSNVKNKLNPFISEGKLKVKVGDSEVNLDGAEIDRIAELALDPNALGSLFVEDKGGKKSIRWGDLTETLYFATNPEGYKNALKTTLQSEAREELEKELRNPGSTAPARPAAKAVDLDNPDFSDPAVKDDFAENMVVTKR